MKKRNAIRGVTLFAAVFLFQWNASAALKGCPEENFKKGLTDVELREIFEAHKSWLNDHQLLNINAWSNRNAQQLKLIFSDTRRANLSNHDLSGHTLSGINLRGAKLDNTSFKGSTIKDVDFSKASMGCTRFDLANISSTSFEDSSMERALFVGSTISNANFVDANLARLFMVNTTVINTNFKNTTLSRARILSSHIEDSRLENSKLDNATVDQTSFANSVWELASNMLPPSYSSARMESISKMKFRNSPASLIELRESFKKAGLRDAERDVTYAIKITENEMLAQNDGSGQIEAAFNYVFFDLTSDYGKSPRKPLFAILVIIFLFCVPYTLAITRSGEDGIWRVWEKERIRSDLGGDPELIADRTYRALLISLQFSIVSTFRMGWKEINVGTWISNIQTREYSLRGSGWVRTLSGLQSLICVYLIAIWALTFFGRPFG